MDANSSSAADAATSDRSGVDKAVLGQAVGRSVLLTASGLGVSPGASPDQIRAAFRRSVRQRHPDTSVTAGNDSAVREVIDAYRLLADPEARARYDTDRAPPRAGARKVRVRTGAEPDDPRPLRSCADCRGTGAVGSVVVCPRCDGRAEFTVLGQRAARVIRCRACHGWGRVRRVDACGRCGGTGTAAP